MSLLALKLANRVAQRMKPETLELSPREAKSVEEHRKAYDKRPRTAERWTRGPTPCGRDSCLADCLDCRDMAAADWFAESAAFAFDYTPEDPEISELITSGGKVPRAEVEALLNPLRDAPADARILLRAAAYFVDLAVNYMTIVAPDDRRPGKPSWRGAIDHDLFQSARAVRRHIPDPLSLDPDLLP